MRQRTEGLHGSHSGGFDQISCTRRGPALTHLSPDNRPWLQQVWPGRNARKDFALRSRAMSIVRDSE